MGITNCSNYNQKMWFSRIPPVRRSCSSAFPPFSPTQKDFLPTFCDPGDTRTTYLGVHDRAGHLFDVGQVSGQGHQDRFSGQADLDDEGDPDRRGGQRGHQNAAGPLSRGQVHRWEGALRRYRGHADGASLLDHG